MPAYLLLQLLNILQVGRILGDECLECEHLVLDVFDAPPLHQALLSPGFPLLHLERLPHRVVNPVAAHRWRRRLRLVDFEGELDLLVGPLPLEARRDRVRLFERLPDLSALHLIFDEVSLALELVSFVYLFLKRISMTFIIPELI